MSVIRTTALAIAIVLGNALPIYADTGGISGYVVDANGAAVPNATVILQTWYPPDRSISILTDKAGFFVNLAVQPGEYIIGVDIDESFGFPDLSGRTPVCQAHYIYSGEVARLKLVISTAKRNPGFAHCREFHPTLVDPNQTADLYRI